LKEERKEGKNRTITEGTRKEGKWYIKKGRQGGRKGGRKKGRKEEKWSCNKGRNPGRKY
jgi:hypothetical protein